MSDEKTSQDAKEAASAPPEGVSAANEATSTEEDTATPEAIARRVAALGEEDQIEVFAREEERKLAERRATKKKGARKGGLEVAASKKLAKIGTRAEPKRTIAVAADADPLIEKTAKLSEWAKHNQKTVQMVGGAIAAVLLGVAGFLYHEHKQDTAASALLASAVEDEGARIGEPPKDDGDGPAPEPGPLFKTFEARRESALKKYRQVESSYPKTGAAILARLAEGSLLLDKHEPDGAAGAFSEVKSSPLAAADQEVKGRALEGLGFAHELKAAGAPAEAAKHYEEALKAYKELENTVEIRGFKELAMYHQARVTQSMGNTDKAKELLVSLKERLAKPEEPISNVPASPSFPYLREVAMDRLREIDPSAAPKAGPAGGAGAAGGRGAGSQLTQEQIKRMIEEAQKKQKSGGGDPHGGH